MKTFCSLLMGGDKKVKETSIIYVHCL